MYCGMTKVPPSYAEGNGNMNSFTWKSAFWVFNFVSNWAYTRYNDMIKDIQIVQRELEFKFINETKEIDAKAAEIYKTSPQKASEFVTEYSVAQGEMTVSRWTVLGQYLFTKYMDGNVKKEKDGKFMTNGYNQAATPAHPEYPQEWYRRIVKDKGEILKDKKLPETK